jgi:two-component sensor histidine kinase
MQQTWDATPITDSVDAALRPFQSPKDRIGTEGPTLLLTPSATITVTLALHELATNAAKYGALSNDSGTVHLRWNIESDNLTLIWREQGGPTVVEPAQTGFGTRLLQRAIAADLGGTVQFQFAPTGLVCTVVAPLSRSSP